MSLFSIQTIYGVEGEHETPFLTRLVIGRLRFHVFHRGDADPDPHDHPWDFWTFPLTAYVEEVALRRIDGSFTVFRQVVRGWRWSYRPATHTHRVIGRASGDGKIFTIVWQGKSSRRWGFLRNRNGHWCWTPWREYVFGGGKHAPCEPAETKPDAETKRQMTNLKRALNRRLKKGDGHG